MRRTLDIIALRLAEWLTAFATRHPIHSQSVKAMGRCIGRDILLARQIITPK